MKSFLNLKSKQRRILKSKKRRMLKYKQRRMLNASKEGFWNPNKLFKSPHIVSPEIIQRQKLFKAGNYSRTETIRGNTVIKSILTLKSKKIMYRNPKVKQKRIKLKLRAKSIWRKIMRQLNTFCNAHKPHTVINVENNS